MDRITYSVSEIAEMLGIGRNIAYELVNRVDFPAVRVGERRIVVPIDKFKSWLDKQTEVI